MTRVVWKWPVVVGGFTAIQVPVDAPVALVAIDPLSGRPAVWIEQEVAAERVERKFRIYGTGEPITVDDRHVGSVVDRGFVWHVYEVGGQG